jgi:hypothetical protein
MVWRSITVVALVALLLGSVPVGAHEQFHIEGTIVSFEHRSLVVKSRTGESFTVQLQESTVVRRERERVPQSELRAGRRVTVNVMADSLYDENPFVLSVTLTASTTRSNAS